MHQIKIFKGLENDLASLEADVNRWLAHSQVRVVQMSGNLAPQSHAPGVQAISTGLPPSDVLLLLLYENR